MPFSYLNADGKPVGYAFTVCQRVADAVKSELGLKTLDVKYQAVTSANRIPLIQNGTVDIECGSTTNSLKRQREAAFSVSYFGIQVSAAVWKSSGIKTSTARRSPSPLALRPLRSSKNLKRPTI